ncbi:MAG: DUF6799 domain-containing protein [Smithellaceae bacterium]
MIVALGQAGLSVMLNMNRIACVLFCLGFLPVVCAPSLQAQTNNPADGVTVKGGEVYCLRGGQLELLTDNLKLPFDIEVNTNGSFKVGSGQERKLEEGQVLRRDGWLLNRDGSTWPVFDYVAMKEGKVIVVRDGEAETLTAPTTFPGNLKIAPDGSCVYPNGSSARLVDGQLFRLDGTSVPAKDTVTLKNGRVVVQKSGTLISLMPSEIMGMNDGTRVRGNGTIMNRDGTITQLREGQTVLIEGAASAH